MSTHRPSNLSVLALAAIAVALCALGWLLTPDLVDGAELRPGALPPGVVVYPTEADTFAMAIEMTEPGDVLVQGPLPQFELWTPVVKDAGKLVVLVGKAGTYNVLVFPQSGQPRVRGFAVVLGPIKPPVPPTPPNPTPTITLTVSPLSIVLGQTAKLLWTCKNATTCTLDGQPVPTDGSQSVTPTAAGGTQYKLTATGKGGSKTQTVALTVTAPPKPARLWAVILYESGQDLKPELAEILRGRALQDWFTQVKWTDADGTPSLLRTDQDNAIANLAADKAKWVTAAIAAGKAANKPLPVLVWGGSVDGPWTTEPCQGTAAEQLDRFRAIAGGAP